MAGFHLRLRWPKWQPACSNWSKFVLDIVFSCLNVFTFFLNSSTREAWQPPHGGALPAPWDRISRRVIRPVYSLAAHGSDNTHPMLSPFSLDTKRFSVSGWRLTLTELEATTSLGLTRLLTLNSTAVAGKESVILEVLLILGVHLHQCTGDGEAQPGSGQCNRRRRGCHDVILLSNFQKFQCCLTTYARIADGSNSLNHLVISDLTVLCQVNASPALFGDQLH